jgi:MFS transporter, DHA1 family, inner membrane transport protein
MTSTLGRPQYVLFACLFASQAALLVLSPILPALAHAFDVSIATAGQLRTISGATGGVTAVVLALLPRRPRLATLLSAGTALVTVGSVLSAAAPSFAVMAAAQGVIGVGIGVLIAVGIAAAGEWSTPEERAHTLAWTIAGMPSAWVLGMPVVGAAAAIDWRLAFLAVPATAGLAALLLVRLSHQADTPSVRGSAPWRRGSVMRFTAGELFANAAWAGVLTYAGTLLIEGYGAPGGVVSIGLAISAAAMVPGTFAARRSAARAGAVRLSALTVAMGALVVAFGGFRPGVAATIGLLAVMAYLNGWRSVIASGFGMDSAPDDKLAVMSMRAAANQFGYLLGAALGGVALAAGGFGAVGLAFGGLFAAGALIHLSSAAALRRGRRTRASTASPAHARPPHRPSHPEEARSHGSRPARRPHRDGAHTRRT